MTYIIRPVLAAASGKSAIRLTFGIEESSAGWAPDNCAISSSVKPPAAILALTAFESNLSLIMVVHFPNMKILYLCAFESSPFYYSANVASVLANSSAEAGRLVKLAPSP